ncbi:MAG: hypothetical protein MI923_23075 [Phycisphaerales bacterium]|nr:hypothetical protein [Phycisphaerales bacterium]
MKQPVRRNRSRRIHLLLWIGTCGTALMTTGCLDSEIAKRFRQAVIPGLVEGWSAALLDPANAETGLRQSGAAVLEAIGSIIQPRTRVETGS